MKHALDDLINLFIQEKDVSKISLVQYSFGLNKFYKWAVNENKLLTGLTTADMIKYKRYLSELKYTHLTISNYLGSVRLFYKWVELNEFGNDITKTLRINKNYSTFRKKSLNINQSVKFLKQFNTKTLMGKRNFAIANLLLRNGLREIEVSRMDVEDVFEYNDRWAIRLQRKGRSGKDDVLPLSEKAKEAIEDYLLHRNTDFQDSSPLFVSSSKANKYKRISTHFISVMIKQKLVQAGIVGKMFTAHSLRHTCATLLIADGHSEYSVKTFMGHRNFTSTQIYTRQKETEMIFNNSPAKLLDEMISN